MKENQKKEDIAEQINQLNGEYKKFSQEIRETHNLSVDLMIENSFKPTDENKKKFEESEAKLKELQRKQGELVDKMADLLRKIGIKEKK